MKKTLVCVLGSPRAETIVWKRFLENVVDSLDADLAICCPIPADFDFASPFWQLAKYKWTCPQYADWGDAYDRAQKIALAKTRKKMIPNWRQVLQIPGIWLGGMLPNQNKGSSAILIYLRWLLLQNLREEGLLDRYDRFVITRSDFYWECAHPPVELLDESQMWIPDGEGYGGVTDRHVVLSRKNIETYLNIIEPILLRPEELVKEMAFQEDWNFEQFLALSLTRSGGATAIGFFPYGMYTVRDREGTTSWSQGTWNDAFGVFIKCPNELDSAKHLARLVGKPADWQTIFSPSAANQFNSVLVDAKQNAIVIKGTGFTKLKLDKALVQYQTGLLLDYVGGVGKLFLGRLQYGEFERALIEDVGLVAKKAGRFALKSLAGNHYYYLDADNRLIKDPERFTEFALTRRYASTLAN